MSDSFSPTAARLLIGIGIGIAMILVGAGLTLAHAARWTRLSSASGLVIGGLILVVVAASRTRPRGR
jgi:hypothetical protein